jgi:hypothetical protein
MLSEIDRQITNYEFMRISMKIQIITILTLNVILFVLVMIGGVMSFPRKNLMRGSSIFTTLLAAMLVSVNIQATPKKLVDRDKDSVSDFVERKAGLDPRNGQDAFADFDFDGYSNLYELQSGTDLWDASSMPEARYPSTMTAIVIPGYHETPADYVNPNLINESDVIQWEQSHNNMAFGVGYHQYNDSSFSSIGYMYQQVLSFDMGDREMLLHDYFLSAQINPEKLYLHFSEDTDLALENIYQGSETGLAGKPAFVGYSQIDDTNMVDLTFHYNGMAQEPWTYRNFGGALYIGSHHKFDEVKIQLHSGVQAGQVSIHQPIDEIGEEWQSTLINDGTSGMLQSGLIKFAPVSNWKAISINGSKPLYFVRVVLESEESPVVRSVFTKNLMYISADQSSIRINGWDARNDKDGDGYISDEEFSQRINVSASARFEHESRVVPYGQMWSSKSAWNIANLFDSDVRAVLKNATLEDWKNKNLAGAYNDDFFKLIGSNQFSVLSGGNLAESNLPIQDAETQANFKLGFDQLMADISESGLVAANISEENMFKNSVRYKALDSMDIVLREGYLTPSMGLNGYWGLQKTWDTAAMSVRGIQSVIMAHNRDGRVAKFGNTEHNWQKDSESMLSIYYLINVTDTTFYSPWNWSFQYGSFNTDEWNYWQSGVPKNYAYQPTALLSFDIGAPANFIPNGYEAMKLTMSTAPEEGQQWGNDYTVIGDSQSEVLNHSQLAAENGVNVLPSYIYYLSRSTTEVVKDVPSSAILARQYQKGLVLYNTQFDSGHMEFMLSLSEEVGLPGWYRRVNADGSLGEPINNIQLFGYEGAILLSVEAP